MRIGGEWKDAVVAQTETESPEVDLGGVFEEVLVIVPTIDSATVAIKVSKEQGGTKVPVHSLDADATGSFLQATTAGVGSIAVHFRCGAQFISVLCGAAQNSAAVTFQVRGV